MKIFKYNNSHKDILNRYINHQSTPNNNSKLLYIEKYDEINGAMFFIEDNNEIIASFGVLRIEMNDGTIVGKLPSRLYIREDYRKYHHKFIDQYFDPAIYEWLEENQITNVMQTVNVGNERPGFLSWKRHGRRRRNAYKYCKSLGQSLILKKWTILPYVINERSVWQYCAWVSLNDEHWKYWWRNFDHIQPHVLKELNASFPYTQKGWLF